MKYRYIQIFSFLVALLSFSIFSACEVDDKINFVTDSTIEQDSDTMPELSLPIVQNPGSGRTTVVLYIPEETPAGCCAVGNMNGWVVENTDYNTFTPVYGTDDKHWVACTFDYTDDMRMKVLAIPSDPDFPLDWSYQWGKNMDSENDLEEDNVVILDGVGTLVVEYAGEVALTELEDNGVIYIQVKSWMTNPVIDAETLEEAWINHPWNGSDWEYYEMSKVADATFEYLGQFGGNGVNIASTSSGENGKWYSLDEITIVDNATINTGDLVKFTFISRTQYVGEVYLELMQLIPSLITSAVTQITGTTAVAGGNVTSDGNASVIERGVVYSTNPNPVITNLYNTIKPCGSGTGSFTCDLTNLQPNTTYYLRAYATNSMGTAYGEEVSFTTGTGTENGYGYVDLGLSVKWATFNVGASKPEEYGDYFAWGEIEPKEVYDWSTYKYCNGSETTLTKYCTSSSNGTVDNKTTLELSDDAARANWGGSWRMPTDAELTELREQCTWTLTTQNSVYGYKVTSKKNGNSIFLPAAGYRDYSSLYGAVSCGHYWSSSLCTVSSYTYNAYLLPFDSDLVGRGHIGRCFGHSVRPVCP